MITTLLTLVLMAAPAEKKAPPPLVWLHNDAKLTKDQQKIVDANKRKRYVVNMNIVSFDFDGLHDPVVIALNDKEVIKLKGAKISVEEDDQGTIRGSVMWSDNKGNSVALSFNRSGKSIFAYIVYDKKVHVIESIGPNLGLVREIDQTKMTKD